jgi:galactoside 2-L-fucosyltransferase 1/2
LTAQSLTLIFYSLNTNPKYLSVQRLTWALADDRNVNSTKSKTPVPISNIASHPTRIPNGYQNLLKQNHSAQSIFHSSSVPPKFYICPTFINRLGNNIFQFASALGIAYKKNMTLIISKEDTVYNIFRLRNSSHLSIGDKKSMCSNADFRKEKQGSLYDENIFHFTPNATYRLGYFLQSWKYFQEASVELRQQLHFREPLQNKANVLMNSILHQYSKSRKHVTLIAIHIRRTDKVNNTRGYQVANTKYFQTAMRLFDDHLFPIFILCTDDLQWSKANIFPKYRVKFISGNSPMEDLALMASCDHVISSVGSFSWWAGWLSNGTVVYFKWPAKEGTALRQAFSNDYMDYFYPHWIEIQT